MNGPIETSPEVSISAFWNQPCYRFFHWDPSPTPFALQQVDDAIDFINNIIERQGPFDGVIGFSQGSVMALATMLRYAKLNPDDDPLFRFAIFFSVPYIPEKDTSGRQEEWGRIRVPSLHICGETDELWFESSKVTAEKNCEKGLTNVIVHKGGHVIPKDKPIVDRVIDAIEDLLDKADSM